ncbi:MULTISPECIES: DivIVA domain-containing protein [Subtercola]|uniref:DivIVA domain-containing protein n=1 Tax=Subtercola vilae TaxID=2056433 RepID=A0A4T2C2R6_9MICO|nr:MULTISPECIES: DivIVA domain-containing protein [Subtercola]MEA9986285.1 DivIVA domain-containing protein [Subtercola sp. RTI3]TIH38270.1 DivIVA domain-containing protein [Subtercola vilae]
MSQTFPHARRPQLGYNVYEVEKFLADARAAYEAKGMFTEPGDTGDIGAGANAGAAGAGAAGAAGVIDSQTIRQASFGLQKSGYSTVHVDAALERLEEAFSARERARAQRAVGEEQWYAQSRERARELLARLERPKGRRFTRAGLLSGGYNRSDVDTFCDAIVAYFRSGAAVTVGDVRSAVFRPKLGGYSEGQVDAVLDAVVDVMLSVR